jgi:hypothetical protein
VYAVKRPSRAALSASLLNGFLTHRTPPDKINDSISLVTTKTRPNTLWLIARAILALPISLVFLLASEIVWKTEGVFERGPNESLSFLPYIYMVLTDMVQLSMWWTAFCLRIRGYLPVVIEQRFVLGLSNSGNLGHRNKLIADGQLGRINPRNNNNVLLPNYVIWRTRPLSSNE